MGPEVHLVLRYFSCTDHFTSYKSLNENLVHSDTSLPIHPRISPLLYKPSSFDFISNHAREILCQDLVQEYCLQGNLCRFEKVVSKFYFTIKLCSGLFICVISTRKSTGSTQAMRKLSDLGDLL